VYARTLTLLAVLGGALVAGGALFAREGLRLVSAISGRDWGGAEPAVGPLALAVLLGAMILVVQTGAFIARRTGAVALAMGAAAVVNVALNFALIPRLGITGAALATAAGFLTALAVLYAMAQRLSHIPYDVGKVLAALAFAAAVALLAPHVETGAVWSDLLTKAGMLLALAVGLLAARVVTTDELAAAMAAVRRGLPARARRPHVEAPP